MAKQGQTAKTTSGQRAIVLGVIVVLVAALYYLVIYRGISENLENAQVQGVTLQTQEREWTAKQLTYRADIEELNRQRARIHEQVKILPIEADMDSFLDNLNSIAELSGLQIQSTAPEQERHEEGFYARLPVKLEMRGRYFQVAKFLFNIGRVERIINMENIELTEPTAVDNDVLLNAKVLATTFRALSEQEMAASHTPQTPAPHGARRRTPGG